MNKKKLLILLAAGFLTILLLAVFWFLRARQPPDTPVLFWTVAFSPDGKTLATAGGQSDPYLEPRLGEIIFWNLATGKIKRTVRHDASLRSIAWSRDGKSLIIGDFNGSTKLLVPSNGKTRAFLPAHSKGVNALAISMDSKLVASSGLDGTITLWDIAAGKEVDTLVLPNEVILNVALAPDGQALVATTRKGKAYLFDLVQRGEPRVLQAWRGAPEQPPGGAEAVAFAPDGASFVTGCEKNLRLWETATGKLIRSYSRCAAAMNSVAFSPDGELLATVNAAGRLTLRNPATDESLSSTQAHGCPSFCVIFSPDGKRVVTVGRWDFTVKIWSVPNLTLLSSLQRPLPPTPPRTSATPGRSMP